MNLTIKETAKLINATEQFVRVGLQLGILPFGYAVKIKKNGKKYTYNISKNRVLDYLGIKEEVNSWKNY